MVQATDCGFSEGDEEDYFIEKECAQLCEGAGKFYIAACDSECESTKGDWKTALRAVFDVVPEAADYDSAKRDVKKHLGLGGGGNESTEAGTDKEFVAVD